MDTISVTYLGNIGSGTQGLQTIRVPYGTTLTRFLSNQGVTDHSRYNIRVNREIKDASYVLQEMDRIAVSPAKTAGAI